MEDFATFRLGILGLLLERLCDEHQNPVVLSELVKRMDAYEATGHEHGGGGGHVHPDDHYVGEDHSHLHPEWVVPAPTVVQVVESPVVVVPTASWSNPPTVHYGWTRPSTST